MIHFEGNYFFLVPKSFANCDIDFAVYDCNGDCVGTSCCGVKTSKLSPKKRIEFEEILQEYSIEFEVKMRFMKEFKTETKNWKKTGLSKEAIIEKMNQCWAIAPRLLERHLLD